MKKPVTGEVPVIPHESDPRITFFESAQASQVKEGGVEIGNIRDTSPSENVPEAKPELVSGGERVNMSGVGSDTVHRSAFHIQPTTLKGKMKAETSQPAMPPASIKVGIDGSTPVEAPTLKAINLTQREALTALIQKAEDPHTPPHMRAHLQDRIIEEHAAAEPEVTGGESAMTKPTSDEKPEEATPAVETPGTEKAPVTPATENPFKEGEDLAIQGEPLSDAQQIAKLLQDVKTVPPKERPAMMREIGRLKKSLDKKANDKEDIGNKIIRSRDVAARAQAKKQALEAKIAEAKQKRIDAGQPEEGAHISGLEKRLNEATNNLVTAEQSYQDLTANFLALGGTQDEIEALIAANSDELPVEKPLVGEDEARKEELAAVAEEVADPVLDAMVAGVAVEALVEIPKAEGESSTETQPQPAPMEMIVATEQIENLEEALNAAREAYVKADVVNRDKIERLSLHFPWLKNEKDVQKNPDLIQLREKYLAVRRAYQDQELKKLSSTPNEEVLKQFLFENSFGEALKLDNEYQRVLEETRGLGGKILAAYEGMGNWYNGLGMKKKAIIGATLFAGSLALGATGMGIGVPAIVWLRRFMAGSGSAMKLDVITEKWQEGASAKKIDKQLDQAVEQAMNLSPEDLAVRMEAFVAINEKGIDQELLKRRKSRAKRKWASRLAGAFGGLAISGLVAHELQPDVVAKAAGAGAGALVSDQTTESLPNADMSGSVPVENSVSGALPHEDVVNHGEESSTVRASEGVATGASEAASQVPGVSELPAPYVVTEIDSSKGLWGALEKSLPANMSETDKNARIAALEKIIASKVAHMTPEMQAAYGFQGGNINVIRPGDTIQFDKLLTPEEWQNPLAVKIEDVPVNSAGVSEVLKASAGESVPSRIDEHFLDGIKAPEVSDEVAAVATEKSVGAPVDLLEGVDIGGSNLLVESIPDDPTRAVLDSGVSVETFKESLGNFRLGVLTTPETANWLKYNPLKHAAEMRSIPMGEVIEAHESIVLNGSYDTTLPFHQSQIEKLHEMTTAAVKQYGNGARPGKLETFEHYTRRLVALGFQVAPKN